MTDRDAELLAEMRAQAQADAQAQAEAVLDGQVSELEGEIAIAHQLVADQERRIAALETTPPPIDYPALADQVADRIRARHGGAK